MNSIVKIIGIAILYTYILNGVIMYLNVQCRIKVLPDARHQMMRKQDCPLFRPKHRGYGWGGGGEELGLAFSKLE